ncbi:hypothetical protein EIN_018700 [Entamoeba invadens IP1]|uniref:hypothetical protein n=1 Tax=Entamoeba invadens IP1 TaxID=370355 RepID=UPI0002C3E4DD|nr:hypothetical protein EIN_018700 [Entamoeba invadens IP1]ELP90511.1 hypothetical protein EIN_018700 [Entamoeba invadens IP1]|eukprot:XP_004257282.1 hypothetical protein EIN_018700 [Entamoeba invadens IP1]
MEPPFPLEQLLDELSKLPTKTELQQDVIYYVDQKKPSGTDLRKFLQILRPVFRTQANEVVLCTVRAVLCGESSDLIQPDVFVRVITDNLQKHSFESFLLLERVTDLGLLSEEYCKNIIQSVVQCTAKEKYTDEALCWFFDALFHMNSLYDLGEVPFFTQITTNSSQKLKKRLVNVLLSSPTPSYGNLLVEILQTEKDEDFLVLCTSLFTFEEFDISAVLKLAQSNQSPKIQEICWTVVNIASMDKTRLEESIANGGIKWMTDTLVQPLSEDVSRNLYGYLGSICCDENMNKKLEENPSWVVLFGKSMLNSVMYPEALKCGFEVISIIWSKMPEDGEIVEIMSEVCVKALFASIHSVENTEIVLTSAINMSVNANFTLYILKWNLEEILDRILLSGVDTLVEKGCGLLMNIIVDPDAAELLCDHYILLSVDLIENYKDSLISALAMGCVAAFSKSEHGREILVETQLFGLIPDILGKYELDSLIDKTLIALTFFINKESGIELLVQSKVLEGIARISYNYDDNQILEKAMNIIVSVAKFQKWHTALFQSKVVQNVVRVIALSSKERIEACLKALSALINIAAVKESRESLFSIGALDSVIYALQQNADDIEVVKLSFGALANLSLADEVKEQTRELGFLEQVRPFLENFKDQFVLLKIITFLYCVTHNSPENKKVVKKKLGDLLKKMLFQFKEIAQFKDKIDTILK